MRIARIHLEIHVFRPDMAVGFTSGMSPSCGGRFATASAVPNRDYWTDVNDCLASFRLLRSNARVFECRTSKKAPCVFATNEKLAECTLHCSAIDYKRRLMGSTSVWQ